MHASQGHHAVSLDATSTMGDGDEPGPLRDRIGSEDLSFDTVEYGEAIGPVLEEISERDRKVLHLRFVEDMTQSEIADQVGVSQMHVSRILRATVEKLRQRIPSRRALAAHFEHEELRGLALGRFSLGYLHVAGQAAQRAGPGNLHLGHQALARPLDQGTDAHVERAVAVLDGDADATFREVPPAGRRDRVAEQHPQTAAKIALKQQSAGGNQCPAAIAPAFHWLGPNCLSSQRVNHAALTSTAYAGLRQMRATP